jgi:hypothetical protein
VWLMVRIAHALDRATRLAGEPALTVLELLTHVFFERKLVPLEAAAVPVPVAAPAPSTTVNAVPSSSSSEQGGGSFWARLEASKKASPTPPPVATETAPSTTASAAPSSSSSEQGGGSFWARLEASKKASPTPPPVATETAPSTTASAAPSSSTSFQSSTISFPFVAPDGRGFHDQRQFRKYMFDTFYTFSDQVGRTLRKNLGEIDGQAFNLLRLEDCEVQLLDHCDAMHVEGLKRCKVFIAASCESVFLRDCHDCQFTMACKQLRTRDCTDCDVSLYSKTDPIIETSSRMRFSPFMGACPALDKVRPRGPAVIALRLPFAAVVCGGHARPSTQPLETSVRL